MVYKCSFVSSFLIDILILLLLFQAQKVWQPNLRPDHLPITSPLLPNPPWSFPDWPPSPPIATQSHPPQMPPPPTHYLQTHSTEYKMMHFSLCLLNLQRPFNRLNFLYILNIIFLLKYITLPMVMILIGVSCSIRTPCHMIFLVKGSVSR